MKKWSDLEKTIFTDEEIRESQLRVDIIGELIKARNERGLSQRELEDLSGIESNDASPQLDTIIRLLAPLGKTLYVGDIPTAEVPA